MYRTKNIRAIGRQAGVFGSLSSLLNIIVLFDFSGLMKGSVGSEGKAERPKTLRKLRNVYDHVKMTTMETEGTRDEGKAPDKSVLSPFDEQEEWAKISEIMASFGTIVRESVLISELEKEFEKRLGRISSRHLWEPENSENDCSLPKLNRTDNLYMTSLLSIILCDLIFFFIFPFTLFFWTRILQISNHPGLISAIALLINVNFENKNDKPVSYIVDQTSICSIVSPSILLFSGPNKRRISL